VGPVAIACITEGESSEEEDCELNMIDRLSEKVEAGTTVELLELVDGGGRVTTMVIEGWTVVVLATTVSVNGATVTVIVSYFTEVSVTTSKPDFLADGVPTKKGVALKSESGNAAAVIVAFCRIIESDVQLDASMLAVSDETELTGPGIGSRVEVSVTDWSIVLSTTERPEPLRAEAQTVGISAAVFGGESIGDSDSSSDSDSASGSCSVSTAAVEDTRGIEI
jgi:hypothetical protein